MGDPKILIRKRKGKEHEGTSQIEISFSQTQEEFISFQDFDLETKFEQSLLRSNYESELKQVEINPNRLQSYLLDSLWKNLQNTVKTKERNITMQTPQPPFPSIVQNPLFAQNPPRDMVARFAALDFPAGLHDLP